MVTVGEGSKIMSSRKQTNIIILSLTAFILTVLCCALGYNASSDDQSDSTPTSTPTVPDVIFSDIPKLRKVSIIAERSFLAELQAINSEILHEKSDEILIDRAIRQCEDINKGQKTRQTLIQYVNYRFTTPNHPNGFGNSTSELILIAIEKYICPELK